MTVANLPNRDRTRNQATVRAQRRLERVVAAGGRRLEVLLDARASRVLDQLMATNGQSARDVISQLLLKAEYGVTDKEGFQLPSHPTSRSPDQ